MLMEEINLMYQMQMVTNAVDPQFLNDEYSQFRRGVYVLDALRGARHKKAMPSDLSMATASSSFIILLSCF